MIPRVPNEVLYVIRQFLTEACQKGSQVWRHFLREEDSITGAFLNNFETATHREFVRNEVWEWNVDYYKVRGRGKGAFEKAHGPDGIFQIIVKDKSGNTVFQKGLLFQAKKINGSYDDLKEQVTKMEKLSSRSSIGLIYGPEGFKGIKGFDVINNDITNKNSFLLEHDIATILAQDFIDCTIGKIDLGFDIDRERLFIVDTFGTKRRIINLQKPSEDLEIHIQQVR